MDIYADYSILILTMTLCIGMVELVVLRNRCASRPDVIDYVNEVIAGAVNSCHNCRVSIPPFIYVYVLR